MRFVRSLAIYLTFSGMLALSACSKTPAPTAPADQTAKPSWQGFSDKFIEHYFATHPTFAVSAGRHEFDGKMPDWSPAAIAADIAYLHAQRDRAMAFAAVDLSAREKFEREYLVSRIDRDLFWLEKAEAPFKNPDFYFGVIDSIDPAVYVARPYAAAEKRAAAFITYAKGIPVVAKQIRANLRSPLPAPFVKYAVLGFNGFADFYRKDVPQAFASVDPQLKQELQAAIEVAATAMQELANSLQAEEKNATGDFALGPQLFADMLWMTERVNTPLTQLEAYGRADLERNLAALKDACKQYAANASLDQCIGKMNSNKPSGGAVEGARAQLAGLKQFITDHHIVTIPGDEQAQVAQAPPYNAQNFAYIDIPGPYEKNLPSVYYIAPADKSWNKAEQNAYVPGVASLLFTTVHEIWPGHFLQFLHSNRSSFRFGQLFVDYAFAEGWAHYAEEMMIEAGLGGQEPRIDPEMRIGQLRQALVRNVRLLSAIGLHTKGMTIEESEKMFREQGMQDPGNARQQASRGTRDPAYLNYTMGKLMIRKLRQDWQAAHAGQTNDQALHEFHDAFLSYGGPPIPLVRAQMLPDQGGSLF